MPIYEYSCQDCETHFEKLVRSMASAPEIKCPACGGTHVKKGWSLFGTSSQANGGSDFRASAAACNVGGT
jgi:putative FmdB family regulatory protein